MGVLLECFLATSCSNCCDNPFPIIYSLFLNNWCKISFGNLCSNPVLIILYSAEIKIFQILKDYCNLRNPLEVDLGIN
jgi:hypothetical protein